MAALGDRAAAAAPDDCVTHKKFFICEMAACVAMHFEFVILSFTLRNLPPFCSSP